MFIKSILLENFQCYYGDNSFEFKEGLNIIIGDNGAGKSKLYDAFYWVLYDKVFNSASRNFEETTIVKNQLIADQAKYLCEIDDYVKTSVSLTVKDTNNIEYILTRTYRSKKVAENDWKDDQKSELSIFKKEVLVPKLIGAEEEQKRVLSRIMPDGIKDYMWFQGEQVDSLIDFKKNDTLTKAINVLSDISLYDTYKEIGENACKTAEDEYRREEKRISSHSQKYEVLYSDRLKCEEKLGRDKKDLSILNENMVRAEEEKQKIIGKIEDAGKITKLQQQIDSKQKTVQRLAKELENKRISFNKNLFSQKWLLLGLNWTDSFGGKYVKYTETKMQREADAKAKINAERNLQEQLNNPRLPINVPEPIYVKKMLEEERCLVCDREAPKDSPSWKKISELLEQKSEIKQATILNEKPANNFANDFQKLYTNGLGLQQNIGTLEDSIKEHFADIKHLEDEHAIELRQLEAFQQDIRALVERSSIDETDSVNITSRFDSYDKQIQQLVRNKLKLEANIDKSKSELSNIDQKLSELTTGKMPLALIEKKQLLQDFYAITVSTRERVYNRLIEQLEVEANKHYISMTAENKAVRGSIKLVKQADGKTYMPRNLDSDGIELSSINDSNIILIKLAVIMAIISAKKSSAAAGLYTLITDAPTSKFSENYAIGFCKTVANVYSQSIIMSKDFYNNADLRKRLIDELGDRLGSMYIIEPSVSETERTSRNTLSVIIKSEKS